MNYPYYYLLIEGKMPVRFDISGFISRVCADKHIFKHVYRIYAYDGNLPKDEGWHILIGDPPIETDFNIRKQSALSRLQKLKGCKVPVANGQKDVCKNCHDRRLQDSVYLAFKSAFDKYEKYGVNLLVSEIERAFRTKTSLQAEIKEDEQNIKIVSRDDRNMKAVGLIDDTSGRIKLISCYKKFASTFQRPAQNLMGTHRCKEIKSNKVKVFVSKDK